MNYHVHVDEVNGESKPDLEHSEPINPHWDYKDLDGTWYLMDVFIDYREHKFLESQILKSMNICGEDKLILLDKKSL